MKKCKKKRKKNVQRETKSPMDVCKEDEGRLSFTDIIMVASPLWIAIAIIASSFILPRSVFEIIAWTFYIIGAIFLVVIALLELFK